MTTKKDDTGIRVRLTGNGVMPATVDVRDLAATLIAMDKAVRAAAQTPENAMALSLLKVTKGSVNLHLGGPAPAQRAADSIVERVVAGQLGELPAAVRTHLTTLTDRAEERGQRLTLTAGGRTADLTGKHRPAPPPLVAAAPIRGATTIYGVVYAVKLKDKDTASVDVKLTDEGRRIVVETNYATAQAIARRLGTEVGLDGDAEWNAATLELTKFTAVRLTTYAGLGDVDDLLEAMAALTFEEDDDENVDDNDDVEALDGVTT